MGELLRELFSHRAPKIVLGVIAMAAAIWFITAGLARARVADACAERLVAAVHAKDHAFVEDSVRNPSLQDVLRSAAHTELLFVRPISTQWTRVGILAKTGTVSDVVHLQLEAEGDRCLFLRDF